MQNINPSKNVNRRGRFYGVMGFFIFLIGLISVALGILLFLLPLFGDSLSTPFGICFTILGIPFGLGGLGIVVRGLTLQKDNPLAYEIGEFLKQTSIGSDARYIFVRNISRRRLGYIDAVLVGPPGVLVFRTVDYSGMWINERTEWRNRTKSGNLKSANTNPTRECAKDVYALRQFLKKNDLGHVPVHGIVVFTSNAANLQKDAPVIPVSTMNNLFRTMSEDYLLDDRINHPTIRATVDAIID